MTVDILLSTFNGASFIGEFLDSLLEQSFQEYTLIVRDDGSGDETLSILHEYRELFGNKLRIVGSKNVNLGPAKSFTVLLGETDADYILFADQDDIWVDNKIEIFLREMQNQEKKYQKLPILVHSDLEVVDHNLMTIYPSFWSQQMFELQRKNLSDLVFQNMVTGCAMMINRSLSHFVKGVESGMIMHDWWAALAASSFGVIAEIDLPLTKYRQHGTNCIGAKEIRRKPFVLRVINLFSKSKKNELKQCIQYTGEQAVGFLNEYRDKLTQKQRQLLMEYGTLLEQSWFRRRWILLKYGIRQHGSRSNLGFLFKI